MQVAGSLKSPMETYSCALIASLVDPGCAPAPHKCGEFCKQVVYSEPNRLHCDHSSSCSWSSHNLWCALLWSVCSGARCGCAPRGLVDIIGKGGLT